MPGALSALDLTYEIEALRIGGIHRPLAVHVLPGGKALNLARALRALGREVEVVTVLGGSTGWRVAEGLRRLGIGARIAEQGAETRQCLSVIDASSPDITEFYEFPPAIEEDAWTTLRKSTGEVRSGFLALSGSVPEDVRLDVLAETLEERSAAGVHVAIDTHGAALSALVNGFQPAVVKVNAIEAAALLGHAGAIDLAKALHERTGALAVVTDGVRGSVAASADGVWLADAPAAGNLAVGSGDCFFAGLLAALDDDDESLDIALRQATAAAAANTLAPGAAVFSPTEARRLAADVTVTRHS